MSSRYAWFAVLILSGSLTARAEVQFLAKQYTRCAGCHVSSTGGSLLTAYGRSLSREEISTTGASDPEREATSGEERSLFGVLGSGEQPIDIGITLRPSRLRLDFGKFTLNRDLLMRADAQVAVHAHNLTAYAEVGRFPSEPASTITREHWLSYDFGGGLAVRGGRFLPAYGIRHSDHTSYHRRDLGFDQDDQIYGVEVSDTGDRQLVQFTLGLGSAEDALDRAGRARSQALGRAQFELGARQVLVLSGRYRGRTRLADPDWLGGVAWGIAPSDRLSLWTSLDTRVAPGWRGTPEYIVVHEAAYEVARGVWLKFSPQLHSALGNVSGGNWRYALTLQLFPRTHWNINLGFQRDRDRVNESSVSTLLFQLHLYL